MSGCGVGKRCEGAKLVVTESVVGLRVGHSWCAVLE